MASVVQLSAEGGSIYEGNSPLGTPLTLFIAQLVIICGTSRLLTKLFAFIKQPSVIAEVVTGIMLGPSLMGRVPGFTETIFPSSSLVAFGVVANMGLILFMFLIGLEVDPRLLTSNLRSSFVISISAMLAPFFLGIAVSVYIYEEVRMAEDATYFSFLLFVGVAISITAFPVLARILTDQNLMQTRVGLIALSSAAVDDVVAWIMLAVVVSIARAEGPLTALYTFCALLAYLFFISTFIRPILALIARRAQSRDAKDPMKHEIIVIILIMVFISAWITEVIGVHAIFGAFLLGVVTPRIKGFAVRLTERIEDVVIIILLPLYFTYSGLRTNLESLDSWQGVVMTILVILASIVGKVGGATLSSRVLGNGWRESLTIGILLNTKGLVELIVLNIGLDVGILTNEIFTGFVLMALVNTFITTPLVWFVWTRHAAKNAPVEDKKEHPSILACISGSRADVLILQLSAAFARAQQMMLAVKPHFSAVSFQEVSERPSTYFFTDFNTLWTSARNSAEMKVKMDVNTSQQENAQFSEVPLVEDDSSTIRVGGLSGNQAGKRVYRTSEEKEKAPLRLAGAIDEKGPSQLYSTFPESEREPPVIVEDSVDLDDAVTRARNMALVLDVDLKLTTRATRNLPKDLAAFANTSSANLVVVGWARPLSSLISSNETAVYLLRHAHPPVALAITKGQTRLNPKHILLVYTFKKYEREALKLALSMAVDPEATIEILVPRPESTSPADGDATRSMSNVPLGSNAGGLPQDIDRLPDLPMPIPRRRWYDYLDVVVLYSLVFDGNSYEDEEDWDNSAETTVVDQHSRRASHRKRTKSSLTNSHLTVDATDPSMRTSQNLHDSFVFSGEPSSVATTIDIEALDVTTGGATFESLTRMVQLLPNVRILTQGDEEETVWTAALREEAKDEHRLLMAGQSRKMFFDPDHHQAARQNRHGHHDPTSLEEFADAVAAPMLVVYPPPSAKQAEKQKERQKQKRRSRRFSLPVS